jgi:cytochrome P450
MTYDYTIEPHKEDPLVRLVDEALDQFSQAAVPGKWLVDVMPWLEFLPEWLPGVQFKKTARLWEKTTLAMADTPYSYVRQRMTLGLNQPSYVSKMVEQHDSNPSPDEEHVIKWTAATLYGAGADTTVSTINSLFLAMSVYPEVQKKAHEEIDRVVGDSRLPTFDDRKNLPYVDAILQEILRWLPVAPLGIPHAADEEAEFQGYRIPKGSVLLPNVWWFTHDPETYHEPMQFKPERYLEPYNEPSPDAIWGYGRRVCAGRVFADASIYLTCVQSLAVFDIRKAVDDVGNEIEPKVFLQGGAIGHPAPFKCGITPRSKKQEALIEMTIQNHPWEASDAQYLQ